jgi:hypothetical protein
MTTHRTLNALLALSLVALSSTAGAAQPTRGRQVDAPPWSFACMTDHGPSPCGEPMWVYGD